LVKSSLICIFGSLTATKPLTIKKAYQNDKKDFFNNSRRSDNHQSGLSHAFTPLQQGTSYSAFVKPESQLIINLNNLFNPVRDWIWVATNAIIS
jgi:hypothetical protein